MTLLVAVALAAPVASQQPAPDMVLFNGKVFTSNPHQPYVEALAIQHERILAVGSTKEIVALAGEKTKRIDLEGRTVIPGINDAHNHIGLLPETCELPLKSMEPEWQEIAAAITASAPKAKKGCWIRGAIGTAVLEDSRATRAALDELAPNHPVSLWAWTGHATLLNTLAMRQLGIKEDEPNPEGGVYVRNPSDGKLTGMAYEYASFRLGDRLAGLVPDAEASKQLQSFFSDSARLGITSIQDMTSNASAARCSALFRKSPPPVRVRVIWFGLTDSRGRLTHEGRAPAGHPTPLVTVSGTKWILDGTPVEYSAAMRAPYADRPKTSGNMDFSQKEMEDILRESLTNNDQLMVHAVGDRTVETLLAAMEATGGAKVWSERRVRIEHGDGMMPDLVPRAKRLGVIVVQNPTHLTLDGLFVKRFGAQRTAQLQPLRSLLDAGIPLAIGSDGPNNPFLNIMLATLYPRRPAEALTREQAVAAYTLTSAYAEFAEKEKGSLEPGKLADLAVLSQDIFTIPPGELPRTEAVLTLVGGQIVYDAKAGGAH